MIFGKLSKKLPIIYFYLSFFVFANDDGTLLFYGNTLILVQRHRFIFVGKALE